MSARTLTLVLVLVGVCLLTVGLQGSTYTWVGSWQQPWSAANQWSGTPAGSPGAGDTAMFVCNNHVNDCVTLDIDRTVDSVLVSDAVNPSTFYIYGSTTLTVTNSFTFNTPTGNGLMASAPNGPSVGGVGFLYPILSGAGSVVVDSGTLDLCNTGNNFTGGIYVNGGYLTAPNSNGGYFGGNTIYLGDSAAGNTNAVLEPEGHSGLTYSNPIVVRAGNSGKAVITYLPYNGNDQDYTSDSNSSAMTFSGPITLNKDVTFRNSARGQNASDPLVISGAVSGNFGVTIDGTSYTYLSGNNTYVGATTITGGAIACFTGAAPTFLGPINVQDGTLYANSEAALGDPSNVLTLGTAHSIGGFGSYNGAVTFTRAISLVGNGYLSGAQTDNGGNSSWAEFQGVISGSGRLIVGMQGVAGWKSTACFMKLDANNTYTGGTVVVAGAAGETSSAGAYDAYANHTIFGTGDLTLKFGGGARITSAANVSGTIFVDDLGYVGGLVVAGDFMPAIDPSSSGTLMAGSGLGSNFAAALANPANPIGNGYMYLGCAEAYQYVPNAGSFAALVANQTPTADGSKTYFIGNSWASPNLWGGLNDFAKLDATNQAMNVQIGKPGLWGEGNVSWVSLAGTTNNFSGSLTIACGSTLWSTSGTDIGSPTGAIYLNGGSPMTPHAGHTLVIDGNNITVTKGDVYFNGSTGITFNLWGGADPVTFAAASYNRQNRGTISFRSETNTLGAAENATVTGAAPAVNNNMVAAYFWQCQDYYYGTGSNSFVTYGANGFAPVSVYLTSLVGSTANDIVYTAGQAVSGSEAAYAVRAGGALTGSGTVTVGDGTSANPAGVLFAAAATHTANFAFGGSEGILYTPFNTVISGTISGSNGITKSGAGSLTLQGNNSGLSGNITVNEGAFIFSNDNQTGTGNLVLNGGAIQAASATAKTIAVGSNGGKLAGTFAGSIVDLNPLTPGPLSLTNGVNINGTGNTYSGGTLINPQGNISVTVGANSCLGTGDVLVDCYVGALPSWHNVLYLEGDNNIALSARLVLMSATSEVEFDSQNPSVGSIEGAGVVLLGGTCDGAGNPGHASAGNPFWNTGAVLTTGLNNKDTEFYGRIQDTNSTHDGTPYFVPRFNGGDYHLTGNPFSAFIKDGTGKFTLWGPVTFYGQTTVKNGTLVNNDLITGNVVVKPGGVDASPAPVYDGTGTTVGMVEVDAGGVAQGAGLFSAGLNVLGGTVGGNITISGPVNVDAAGSFCSSGPITGAVATAGAFAGNANITGNVNVTGGTFGGNHVINGTFASNAAVSGASIFNGAVTLTGGTFTGTHAINANYTQNGGSSSGTSTFGTAGSPVAVTVNAGSFSGNHTIYGSFTTSAGSNAVVAPHDGPIAGTLTVVGNVSLDHSTVLNFNLGPAGTTGGNVNDYISITGNLSLDGTLIVNNLAGFASGTYTLIDYSGALTGAGLTLGITPAGYNYTLVNSTPNEITLVVSTIGPPGWPNSLDIDATYRHLTVLPPGFTGWGGQGGDQPWPWAQSVYQAKYDVNNDGVVSQDDVTYGLKNYFFTSYGDADLSRATDFEDFQTLLDHWQNSGAGIGWAEADFNGDGVVDFLDFQNLLDYWNPSGWNFAPTQTPEPASLSLILLGGLALLRRSRK